MENSRNVGRVFESAKIIAFKKIEKNREEKNREAGLLYHVMGTNQLIKSEQNM